MDDVVHQLKVSRVCPPLIELFPPEITVGFTNLSPELAYIFQLYPALEHTLCSDITTRVEAEVRAKGWFPNKWSEENVFGTKHGGSFGMQLELHGDSLSADGSVKQKKIFTISRSASRQYSSKSPSDIKIMIKAQVDKELVLPPILPDALLGLVESYCGAPLPTIRPLFGNDDDGDWCMLFPEPSARANVVYLADENSSYCWWRDSGTLARHCQIGDKLPKFWPPEIKQH